MSQNPKIYLWECATAAKNLIHYLDERRTDESFNSFIKEAAQVNILPEFPPIRQRKVPRTFVYESNDETIVDPKQNFKVNFYFSILDTSKTALQE